MLTLKINYWDRVSYTSCNSEIKRTEDLSAETEDALFESFYKKNNQLKYCNGAYYKFNGENIAQGMKKLRVLLDDNEEFVEELQRLYEEKTS